MSELQPHKTYTIASLIQIATLKQDEQLQYIDRLKIQQMKTPQMDELQVTIACFVDPQYDRFKTNISRAIENRKRHLQNQKKEQYERRYKQQERRYKKQGLRRDLAAGFFLFFFIAFVFTVLEKTQPVILQPGQTLVRPNEFINWAGFGILVVVQLIGMIFCFKEYNKQIGPVQQSQQQSSQLTQGGCIKNISYTTE